MVNSLIFFRTTLSGTISHCGRVLQACELVFATQAPAEYLRKGLGSRV